MEAMFAMSDDIGKSSDPLGGDAMDVDEKPDGELPMRGGQWCMHH